MSFFIELLKYILAPLIVGLILLLISKKMRSSKPETTNKKDIKKKLYKQEIFNTIATLVLGATIGFLIILILNWFVFDKQLFEIQDSSESVTVIEEKFTTSIVGNCDTPGQACSVFIDGDYAYIADLNNGLQILNIVDKENPKIIGNCNIDGDAIDVFVENSYAFVLSRSNNDNLVIVDVENKERPKIINNYIFKNSLDEIVKRSSDNNRLISLLPMLKKIFVVNDYAYIVDNIGLKILNIQNKYEVELISSCDTFYDAVGIYVDGNYAYIADRTDGIQIVDIGDIENPSIVGMFDTDGTAFDIYVDKDYAYVADGSNGIQIIDISNRIGGNVLKSSFSCDLGFTTKVVKEEDYLFSISNSNIEILEIVKDDKIFELSECYVVGRCITPGKAKDIYVRDEIIYVADSGFGLQVIKINKE